MTSRRERAFVELGIEGLEAAKAKLKMFGDSLKTLGSTLAIGFAVDRVTGWIESFADAGREIFQTARDMQMSVTELQEMRGASKILGIEMETMTAAVHRTRQYVAELAVSGQQSNDVMRELGLTLSDVANLSDLDRLQLFGERIRALGNREMTSRIGRQIMGRGGVAVAASAAELGSAREKARGGRMFSEEEVRQAYELYQVQVQYKKVQESIGKEIALILLPAFRFIYMTLIPIIKGVKTWIVENASLVRQIAVAGALLIGIATVMTAITMSMAITGIIAATIAALFSPITIAVVAAAALVVTFVRLSEVLDLLKTQFVGLGEIFDQVWSGISDALVAGDIELAWQILVAGMKSAWAEFNYWFKQTFGVSVNQVFNAMRLKWVEDMAFMKRLWVETQGFFARTANVGQNLGTRIAIAGIRARMALGHIDRETGELTIRQLERDQEAANDVASGEAARRAERLGQIELDRLRGRGEAIEAFRADNAEGDLLDARGELDHFAKGLFMPPRRSEFAVSSS